MADLGRVGRLMVGMPGAGGAEWVEMGATTGDGLALTPADPAAPPWGTPSGFPVVGGFRREMAFEFSGTDAGKLGLYLGELPAPRPQAARPPRPRFADQAARPYCVAMRAATVGGGSTQILAHAPGVAVFMPSAVIAVAYRGAPGRPRPRRHHSRPAQLAAACGYRRRVRNRRRRGK